MIALKFLSDTPFDKFEGIYKLALDCYPGSDVVIALDESIDPAHIRIEIYGYHTAEEIEADLAKYSHWFEVVE